MDAEHLELPMDLPSTHPSQLSPLFLLPLNLSHGLRPWWPLLLLLLLPLPPFRLLAFRSRLCNLLPPLLLQNLLPLLLP